MRQSGIKLLLINTAFIVFTTASFCLKRKIRVYALLIINSLALLINACTSLTDNRTADRFIRIGGEMKEILHSEEDDSFYRITSALNWGRSDAMLYGYNSLDNYASTENLNFLKGMKHLGLEHTWYWGKYNSNMPHSATAMLDIKYQIEEADGKYELVNNKFNPLPLAFVADEYTDIDYHECDDFKYMNELWHSYSNEIDQPVFEKIDFEKNVESGEAILKFTNVEEQLIYISMRQPVNSVYISENGNKKDIEYTENERIYRIGTFEKNSEIEVHIELRDEDGEFDLYYEDFEVLEEYINKINMNQINLDMKSSSEIKIDMSADKSKYLVLTIPYDDSWNISVNKEKVFPKKYGQLFMAIPVNEGNNSIELSYIPKGFRIGTIISLFSLVLFIVEIVCQRKEKRFKNK